MRFEVEAGCDAEILAAAAKGEVEVWMGGVAYVCYCAVRKDDLDNCSVVSSGFC